MSRREPPLYREVEKFCKHHLGRDCFAPLTGQDYSAWRAFVYLVELYGRGDLGGRESALVAMNYAVKAAQQGSAVQRVFLQSIPAVLDWGDAPRLWPRISPMVELRVVQRREVQS